jgi:7-cyano-7-deazaguanine synthase in queuosine biosynthesis
MTMSRRRATRKSVIRTDYSRYSDCREARLKALQEAIRLGTEADFTIETPLRCATLWWLFRNRECLLVADCVAKVG